MSQEKKIQTPAGAVWVEKLTYSRTREQLHVFAHTEQAVDYPAFMKIQEHLIEQTGQENTLVSLHVPMKCEKEFASFCVGFAKNEMRTCGALWPKSVWEYNKENHAVYCAFEEEQLREVVQMMPAYPRLLSCVEETSGAQLFFVKKEKLALGIACTELIDFEKQQESQHSAAVPDGQGTPKTNPEPKAQLQAEKPKPKPKKKAAAKAAHTHKTKALLGEAFFPKKTDDLSSVSLDLGRVTLEGLVVKSPEARQKRSKDGSIVSFSLTDYYGTMKILCSMDNRETQRALEVLSKKKRVFVRGEVRMDPYSKQDVIWAFQISYMPFKDRGDGDLPFHRPELHAHTKMSSLDALADTKELVETAANMGLSALAITDHGVVQAFPLAYDACLAHKELKLIYGVEAYLANDMAAFTGQDAPIDEVVVFDIETTGLDKEQCEIIEIGAVRWKDGKALETFEQFAKPKAKLPPEIVKLTGITDQDLADAPSEQQTLEAFARFVSDTPLVAHNATFDLSFIRNRGRAYGLLFENDIVDTLPLARMMVPDVRRHSLDAMCRHFKIEQLHHHRANDDAACTARLWEKLKELAGAKRFSELNGSMSTKALPTNHLILLVKNKKGLKNLYTLITEAHLRHFHRRPVMPKSLVMKHREGLIIGGACEQGEVFRSVLGKLDPKTQSQIADFYDYLEVQPLGNNAFLIHDDRDGFWVHDNRDLENINKRIIALAKEKGIPVVATGDVHFIKPQDEYLRRILMSGQGFTDADNQPPLYLHTTQEMLDEFSYLDEDEAMEVVVNAPNRIVESIETGFGPYPQDTAAPREENGDELICSIARKGAEDIYGSPLPEIVSARLEKELGSITKHDFSTLYLSAYRLVKQSNDDGYTVGSRGSVGSSFVAKAMGISEVNPLAPHYVCPHCKFSDFDVKELGAACGPDLPDRDCPQCGTKMAKDGYEIPFEVFLGFDGDKVPDIDLNFSGEYQPRAFAKVIEMFGQDNVFRAGTVIGVAAKSAYGYVRKYMEEKGIYIQPAQIDLLTKGIENVKRTTGQHPAGLIVVPEDRDILDYTPLQRPADKTDSETITTHFDFNSLHDRLVKLDILGHDNPTVIRRLYEFTGIDPVDVPLDDPGTLSLFLNCDALDLKDPEFPFDLGVLGVPEFGTEFAMNMLKDTRPTTVAELLRISGLSHGTDVWLGNAADLIANGVATLRECVCTRDDIMVYLMHCGVDSKIAFDTMESVRKGKGLKPVMENAMRQAHVPDWYIESCKKIQYMFPKAHAAAYVVAALRIAYYKVHMPLAFYAAYFSVRGEEMDAYDALQGIDHIKKVLAGFKGKRDMTARDEKQRVHLQLAMEMLARGYEFMPPDIQTSHATMYEIVDGKIRMPLSAVGGLGENAALSVVEARKDGPFATIEDVNLRTKLNNSNIQRLKEVGAFGDMWDTAQLSLF